MNQQRSYVLACIVLCTTSAPAWSQDGCHAKLRVAQDKTVDPSQRQGAAREARLCFEIRRNTMLQDFAAKGMQMDEGTSAVSGADSGVEQAEDAEADAQSADSFESKYGLGVGIGFSWGRGEERVDDAEVVNGVVRVKRESTDKPRLFLEAHKFLWVNSTRSIGAGPFVSIQSGADDALSSWGLGAMFGFRDDAAKGEHLTGWNLGLGYLWDADVKTLGDGVTADAPLPEGETEIRYKNSPAGSVFVVFSRKF